MSFVMGLREMAPPTIDDIGMSDLDRSNKGASKQRRDQINAEIATMRDLLPLPESSRQRLSQLQIMSLTCVYIRKCNVFQKLFHQSQDSKSKQTEAGPEMLDFFQALTGFLLVTTREGKLLYISENVTEFLGHSMVDMKTQGDSLYDIVDKRDQAAVQAQLMAVGQGQTDGTDEVSFFCRMNMSRTLKRQSGFGDVKIMHVRGHMTRVSESGSPLDGQHVLMATCSPLVTSELKENLVQNNTMVFKTVHQLDMSYVEVTNVAEHHLGYSSSELSKQSWYSMIHPEDIREAKDKHVQLIRSNHEIGSMMTVRMLRSDGSSFWVNVVMHIRQAAMPGNDEPHIVCINQVINAKEAYQIKVQNHMFSLYPTRAHEMWSTQLSVGSAGQDTSNLGHWVQPVTGYQTSVPSVLSPRPCYQLQCAPGMSMAHGHKIIGLSPASYNATAVMQSDKLKAMLKRKIQGPQVGQCRPNKLAKMNWMDDSGYHGYGDVNHSMMEGYSQVQMPLCVDSQGQTLQMVQPSSYSGGVPLTAMRSEVLSCQGIPMPMMTKCTLMTEQVVPDVNVPESYLTPEPSPANSPQPIKTENADQDYKPQSMKFSCHLQALEKLASGDQKQKQKIKLAPSVRLNSQTEISTNCKMQTPIKQSQRRKKLPELDAFDVDIFFDLLQPKVFDRVDKMERVIKKEIKTEVEEEVSTPVTSSKELTKVIVKEEFTSEAIPLNGEIRKNTEGSDIFEDEAPRFCDDIADLSSPKKEANNPSSSLHGGSSPMQIQVSSPKAISPCSAASSPYSAASEGGFDLLSCFSDDGLDLSPLHMDPPSMILDSSVSEKLGENEDDDLLAAFYSEGKLVCKTSSNGVQESRSALPEELSPALSESPRSVSSLLAVEEECIEDSSGFSLTQALKELGSDNESCASSLKDRDVLGEFQELDLLLGAY